MNIYHKSAERLGCLIVNEGSKHEGSCFSFHCSATHICQNDKCFWKQRDCYGLCPWVVFDETGEHEASQRNIIDKYGEAYFPEWEVCVGTNCLYCSCKDFKNGQYDN